MTTEALRLEMSGHVANIVIDRQANSPTVEDAVYGSATTGMQDTTTTTAAKEPLLTKHKRD